MKTILIFVSSILAMASVVPYVIEIIRGKAKPRIVSWLTWTLLISIACAGSFASHQVANGVLTLFDGIGVFTIVVVGFKYGDRTLERMDVMCQLGALAGLGAWFAFNSPLLAVLVSVLIDLVGSLPTLKHSWKQPHEETWPTYFMGGMAGLLTAFAATGWTFAALLYPLYLIAINFACTTLILRSPHRHLSGEPAELRDL